MRMKMYSKHFLGATDIVYILERSTERKYNFCLFTRLHSLLQTKAGKEE